MKHPSLPEALAAFDATMTEIGSCGDGGCLVKKPVGMHTNGGCKCLRNDHFKAQRIAMAAWRLRNAVEAAVTAS